MLHAFPNPGAGGAFQQFGYEHGSISVAPTPTGAGAVTLLTPLRNCLMHAIAFAASSGESNSKSKAPSLVRSVIRRGPLRRAFIVSLIISSFTHWLNTLPTNT
uniref:Uncharacterized protein n=1 Tax=Opuntia streptacantha TaxID=393608 RepID=A0A7C9D6G6_OPUST